MKEFFLLVNNTGSLFKPYMKRGLAYRLNKNMLQPIMAEMSSLGFNVTFDPSKHKRLSTKYEL